MKKSIGFFFLIALSGALPCLAFPPFKFWFLEWFAFVPILLLLDSKKNNLLVFISGLSAGFVFYAFSLYWIYSVAGFFYLFLAIYLAVFWGIFFSLLLSFPANVRCIIGAGLWFFLEIIIQYLFTGFPWLPLSLSQWAFPYTVRMVSITGSAGLSALIIALNISIYAMIKYRKFLQFITCLTLTASAGLLSNIDFVKHGDTATKIIAVQGNSGYFGQFPEDPFEKYRNLTETITTTCDLVVWPESSYPSILRKDEEVFNYLINKSHQFPILMGAMNEENGNVTNSAFYFRNGGFERYDKRHLVPFGEYVPGEKLWIVKKIYKKIYGGIPDIKPGKDSVIFNPGSKKFSVLICFENIFSSLVQDNMENNPDFFITITNDSWYGDSSGPYQHFAHNILRATETGRFVIQVSTTGITGYATPDGKHKTLNHDNKKMFISGIMEIDIPDNNKQKNIYTRIGDIGLSTIFLLLTGACLCRKI